MKTLIFNQDETAAIGDLIEFVDEFENDDNDRAYSNTLHEILGVLRFKFLEQKYRERRVDETESEGT